MRKRALWIVIGGLAAAWFVVALFVCFYDPTTAPEALPRPIAELMEDVEGPDHAFFLFAHGYSKQWSVETWEGEDGDPPADASRASYSVVRGALDRKAATFPFAVSWSANHAMPDDVLQLSVTSSVDWNDGDDATWTPVGEARVHLQAGGEATTWCHADVSAATTAYRVHLLRQGVVIDAFSKSMLTAPTAAGRFYDAVAWRWPFGWLPTLR